MMNDSLMLSDIMLYDTKTVFVAVTGNQSDPYVHFKKRIYDKKKGLYAPLPI